MSSDTSSRQSESWTKAPFGLRILLLAMWRIENLQVKRATLDFTSSGQGKRQVQQLFSDDIKLINALELVDWAPEDTQLLVCEECGFTHCKRGDWVSVRRADSLVFLLLASDYVWGDEEAKREYSPPAYLKEQGIAYMDSSTYERLRSMHSLFSAIDQIQPLTLKEATLLFQWNAPDRILGEPPEVKIRSEIIVGSSEGDYAQHLNALEDLIRTQYASESIARLRSISNDERVISLSVDAAQFSEWDALVFDGSDYRLLVDSRYVVDTK